MLNCACGATLIVQLQTKQDLFYKTKVKEQYGKMFAWSVVSTARALVFCRLVTMHGLQPF